MRILKINGVWLTECPRSFISDHKANTTDGLIPVTNGLPPRIKSGGHYDNGTYSESDYRCG
jgi:hypothetical protein